MTLTQFFTASGVLLWAWLAWRAFQLGCGLSNRLRWALVGHKRSRTGRWLN